MRKETEKEILKTDSSGLLHTIFLAANTVTDYKFDRMSGVELQFIEVLNKSQ